MHVNTLYNKSCVSLLWLLCWNKYWVGNGFPTHRDFCNFETSHFRIKPRPLKSLLNRNACVPQWLGAINWDRMRHFKSTLRHFKSRLTSQRVSCKPATGHATTSVAGASLHSINMTASYCDLNPAFSGLMNISPLKSETVSVEQLDKNLPQNTHEPGTSSWDTVTQAHIQQSLTAPTAQMSAATPMLCTVTEHANVSLYVLDPSSLIKTTSLFRSIFWVFSSKYFQPF